MLKYQILATLLVRDKTKELVTMIAVSTTPVIVYVDNCVEIVGHNCEAASRGPGSPAVAVPNPALTGSPITGLGGNMLAI